MSERLRTYLDELVDRLFFIPLAFVITAILTSQVSLAIDRQIEEGDLPDVLQTTVDSARTILATIAGGLISSVTLLLSLTLVAVQLASSQFSPRTLRNWIGDRTLQSSIGMVLGTSVFCLLILRDTRNIGDATGDEAITSLVPHVSVLLAVVLGVASLVSVVRAVDHLTDSLRIGTVAQRILQSTLSAIEDVDEIEMPDNPTVAPASTTDIEAGPDEAEDVSPDAVPVVTATSGWVERIDEAALFDVVDAGSTTWVTASVGTFALPDAPLMWTTHDFDPDDQKDVQRLTNAFVLGTSRTMTQDVGYGILRMVDIALRALSPGVNDPNTANDMIMHLAVIVLRLWERPASSAVREQDDRKIVLQPIQHADYLTEAFDPIRRHGCHDPDVAETMVRALRTLRSEVERRDLPGPIEPIDEMIDNIIQQVEASELLECDKELVRRIVAS